jgi:hypothetical protein
VKEVCRYLACSAHRTQFPQDKRVVRYLTPDCLEEFSEVCEID